MTTMHHFGFIGFGLIGGSVAHALREQYPDSELMAYNYYITKPHPRLELAAMDGILDKITTDLADFADCDCIFLCAPVIKKYRLFGQAASLSFQRLPADRRWQCQKRYSCCSQRTWSL